MKCFGQRVSDNVQMCQRHLGFQAELDISSCSPFVENVAVVAKIHYDWKIKSRKKSLFLLPGSIYEFKPLKPQDAEQSGG